TDGRLQLGENLIHSEPKDPQLEAKAAEALSLFTDGADVVQTRLRTEAGGLSGYLKDMAISARHNVFVMPSGSFNPVENSVQDSSILMLKDQMHRDGKGSDVAMPSALVGIDRQVDAPALESLMQQPGVTDANRATLDALAQKLRSGEVKPWDLK